jgi:hypothetical protein
MPNHFTALGFTVETEGDFEELVTRASREGDPIAAPSGYYLQYRVGDHIELWAQATPIGDLLDCVPYYQGESRLRIGVADLIRRSDRPLDGSVYGWVNPSGPRADGGDYPVVIKIPDFEIFRARVSPQTAVTMQVTAFTNEIEIFDNDDTFAAAQPERGRMAAESFVPAGLFADGDGGANTPEAHAIFSGHVRTADLKANPQTGRNYYYLTVSTFGGIYDVVADPELVPRPPEVGNVVRGSFWLTGRLTA